MPLTRTHIAFLGIISMITGIIAPGTETTMRPLSYLMTDMRLASYITLFCLILAFGLAAMRMWQWYRMITVGILLSVGYILFMTLFFHVTDIKSGMVTSGILWGWIFLTIGCALMLIAYRRKSGEKEDFSETIDAIIGIVGGFALACIVGILIISSLSLLSTRPKTSVLGEFFGSGNISTLSGGIQLSKPYKNISTLFYDRKTDTLTIVSTTKDGKKNIEVFGSGESLSGNIHNSTLLLFKTGSIGSSENTIHSMSGEISNGVVHLVYDGKVLSRDLEEVREIFMGNDGSYAYFGRPLGEKKFCIFTRYRGNFCGLDGYMNPTLGADGSSVIFAGYKDNIWSIYRNTLRIVKDTGYTKSDSIASDYIFFDITHPETYLIIEKDQKTGLYTYRKNGKPLKEAWEDVGTEVYFGYDNHIITKVKDQSGWRVIEL